MFTAALLAVHPAAAQAVIDEEPAGEDIPAATLRVQTDPTAADCPSVRELASAVKAQLHVHAERKPKMRLTVSVVRQGSDYLGHIAVEGPRTGERILRVPGLDCSGLRDALVVTLALILDEAAEPQPVSAPMTRLRTRPARRETALATHDERSVALGVGAALTEALPRDFSAALRAELEFSSGHFGTALGAFLAPKTRVRFEPGSVDLQLWGGQARLCRFFWHDGAKGPVLGLCADGVVGKLTGRGHDFTSNQAQSRPWVALGASASVSSPLDPPVGWAVRAVVTFPLQRDAFAVSGIPGTAYEVPVVSFGLEALLRMRVL